MGGGVSMSRWKRAIKKFCIPCASLFSLFHGSSHTKTISCSALSETGDSTQRNKEKQETTLLSDKLICAICLDPLISGSTSTREEINTSKNTSNEKNNIFVAFCSHSFHFPCILSNIRHGNLTCPICRAEWSNLPRDLRPTLSHSNHQNSDPIFRILDHSIAVSRVNRRSTLRTVRYNDDDPIEPNPNNNFPESNYPSLQFSLIPAPNPSHHLVGHHYPCGHVVPLRQTRAYLSVRLAPPPATDLVLVVSANGPHIRVLKQSMALVIFSLRAIDRLAIVTYSTTATRAFPLRRMTSNGKRLALQVIDRISYIGGASPSEGIQKGVKILEDRMNRNPIAHILHLSNGMGRTRANGEISDVQFPVHRFHIGLGFGVSNGIFMREFEDFIAGLLGGFISETRIRIGEQGGLIRLGELRGGEERRIPVELRDDCGYVLVGFSYFAGGREEEMSGEVMVGFGEKNERCESDYEERESDRSLVPGRRSCGERWEYLDPFMARRWAKHLHGYNRARGRDDRCLV